MRINYIGYFFLFLLIFFCSCQKKYIEYYENKSDESINIIFSSGELEPAFSEDNYRYNITSLNSIDSITVQVKCPEVCSVRIGDKPVAVNVKNKIKLEKLSWDKTLTISIDDKVYAINLIHDKIPRFGVIYDNPSPGNIYYAAGEKGGYMTMISNIGEVLYYNTQYDCNSFRKEISPRGEVRYIAFKGLNVPVMQGAGYGKGSVIVMDEHFNVINEVFPKAAMEFSESYAESHDFIYLDDNHFIFSMYSPQIVTNIPETLPQNPRGARVLATHLQEIINSDVVWEWISTDYPQFYQTSVEGNDFTNISTQWADYMHCNSIYIDSQDNNLICSFRRQCSIIKINRKNGNVMWTLSGEGDEYSLLTDQKMKFQHFARIFTNPDGTKTVTAYDNRTSEPLSRLVEYKIDESLKRLLSFKEIKGPYSGSYNGSVQKLESSYFFNWGGPKMYPGYADITEISEDGSSILFDLFFVKSPNNVFSYRAYKIR